MQKLFSILILFILFGGNEFCLSQEYFQTTNARTRFYSSAPLEDIEAISNEGISVINGNTGEISFQIKIRSYKFRKALMQEHFNENFMESHKYPNAAFKGKILDKIDLSSHEDQKVTINGILDVHGVKKERIIPATIKINNGELVLTSQFDVACKDHDIKIPKIFWKNIAEVIQVNVNAKYKKLQK